MKNKTILLWMALAIFASLLSSCQKETISPTPVQETSTTELPTNPDLITLTNPNLEPQNLANFPIAVNSTTCPTGGFTLTVTSPDVDLSNGDFTINWYKNTEQVIYSVGQELECVCGFGVRIEVLDASDTVVADTSLDIPGC